MARLSAKALARDAVKQDTRARTPLNNGHSLGPAKSLDSFKNMAHRLGVGADNPLTDARYGFNPISRNRLLLEWMYRGSWLAGNAVDLVADDMTRAGIEFINEMPPDQVQIMEAAATTLKLWDRINETIKWGRLYGGAIAVALVDGQDTRTPLRMDTVAPGQFRGLLVLDRWQIEPTLEDLVTELGPNLGLPRFYRVQSNAPALRGQSIHYSRVMVRHEGIELPYQQKLTENLWGISVLERLYDRMIAFDSASAGSAQLVYRAYYRTLAVEGMREIVAGGGKPYEGLLAYVEQMRRYQGIEGMTLIDSKDKIEHQQHSAFSGLSDVMTQFGQQLSGALQIPLVRLFGQSPAGLNATGESDLRTYYDNIAQRQQRDLHTGVTALYRLLAAGVAIRPPSDFALAFKPLWQLDAKEKGEVASSVTETVSKAHGDGLISQQVALKELRQSSRTTGIFSNITQEDIDNADDVAQPPAPDPSMLPPGMEGMNNGEEGQDPAEAGQAGPQGQAGPVDQGARRRVRLQNPAPGGSPPSPVNRPGMDA